CENEAEVLERTRAKIHKLYDLSELPLFRVSVCKTEDGKAYLFTGMHHVITDAEASQIFWDELLKLYIEETGGAKANLPKIEYQYADYANWQRKTLKGEILARGIEFWKDELKGTQQVLKLPTDY